MHDNLHEVCNRHMLNFKLNYSSVYTAHKFAMSNVNKDYNLTKQVRFYVP